MANFDACLSISICLHFWCNIRVGMFFWGDCSWIFVTDIIMGMGSGGTQRPRPTHTLYHSSIKPTSRFYSYIYYIVSEYVFWPLLYFWHTVYACLWYSWWKWFMLASLVCNFNVCCTDYFVDSSQCEGHSGEKKKKTQTLSLGESSRCIRSLLPSVCCNFQIWALCFSVLCVQIALFLVSHGPQQMEQVTNEWGIRTRDPSDLFKWLGIQVTCHSLFNHVQKILL